MSRFLSLDAYPYLLTGSKWSTTPPARARRSRRATGVASVLFATGGRRGSAVWLSVEVMAMVSRVGSVHGAVGIWLDYSKAGKSFGSSDFRVLRCSYAHLLITRILPLRGATLQRDTRYTRTTPTLAPPLDLPLLPRPLRPPPRCELTSFPRLSALVRLCRRSSCRRRLS